MSVSDSAIANASKRVLAGVEEQIRELQPALQKQVEIARVAAALTHLKKQLENTGLKTDEALDDAIQLASDVRSGKKSLSEFGDVLVALYVFQQSLDEQLQELVATLQLTSYNKDSLDNLLLNAVIQIRQILNIRPDVTTVMDDLAALKNLRGGPADATSFHDFHVLTLAFESVWMHAFDENLRQTVQTLFAETVRLYADHGLVAPNFDAINDIEDLNNFTYEVKKAIDPNFVGSLTLPPPLNVTIAFPEAVAVWYLFSDAQRVTITTSADAVLRNAGDKKALEDLKRWVANAIKNPQGNVSRLTRLLSEITKSLSEPYAFDVFAPNSYNFGLMITYRQRWEPGAYQAGDLVATIPLAPGESRKFSKRRVVKTSRATKELERAMSSRSEQSSEASRAEAEIMRKVNTATNFKMTAHGSFNIGVVTVDATTDFTVDQQQQSSLNKKAFHEATLKAAEEYKLDARWK